MELFYIYIYLIMNRARIGKETPALSKKRLQLENISKRTGQLRASRRTAAAGSVFYRIKDHSA